MKSQGQHCLVGESVQGRGLLSLLHTCFYYRVRIDLWRCWNYWNYLAHHPVLSSFPSEPLLSYLSNSSHTTEENDTPFPQYHVRLLRDSVRDERLKGPVLSSSCVFMMAAAVGLGGSSS